MKAQSTDDNTDGTIHNSQHTHNSAGALQAFGLSRRLDNNIGYAGVGLDFSSATQVIFAELPDEVSLLRQAEDRAHRKGQTKPVNVYFLVIRHPLEERRQALLTLSGLKL